MVKGEFVRFLDECGGKDMPLRFILRCKGCDEAIVCDVETIEVVTVDGKETISIECA